MPPHSASREDAFAAYSSRHSGILAGVTSDIVLAALDRVNPSLQIRHITFRTASHEVYLVTPESSQGRWAGVIIPGQTGVDVTLWSRGVPCAKARSDAAGVAIFPDIALGPVRFVFRRACVGPDDVEIDVQTEWILLP